MNKHRENTKVLLDRGKVTGVVEFSVSLGDKHFTASRNITESNLISFEGELKANKLQLFKEQVASIRNQTDLRGTTRLCSHDPAVLTGPATCLSCHIPLASLVISHLPVISHSPVLT